MTTKKSVLSFVLMYFSCLVFFFWGTLQFMNWTVSDGHWAAIFRESANSFIQQRYALPGTAFVLLAGGLILRRPSK